MVSDYICISACFHFYIYNRPFLFFMTDHFCSNLKETCTFLSKILLWLTRADIAFRKMVLLKRQRVKVSIYRDETDLFHETNKNNNPVSQKLCLQLICNRKEM